MCIADKKMKANTRVALRRGGVGWGVQAAFQCRKIKVGQRGIEECNVGLRYGFARSLLLLLLPLLFLYCVGFVWCVSC